MKTKVCAKCGKEKPTTAFYTDTRNNDNLQSYCKECVKEQVKEKRIAKMKEHRHKTEKYKEDIKYTNPLELIDTLSPEDSDIALSDWRDKVDSVDKRRTEEEQLKWNEEKCFRCKTNFSPHSEGEEGVFFLLEKRRYCFKCYNKMSYLSEKKICNLCYRVLPLTDYHKRKKSSYSPYCKNCDSLRSRFKKMFGYTNIEDIKLSLLLNMDLDLLFHYRNICRSCKTFFKDKNKLSLMIGSSAGVHYLSGYYCIVCLLIPNLPLQVKEISPYCLSFTHSIELEKEQPLGIVRKNILYKKKK